MTVKLSAFVLKAIRHSFVYIYNYDLKLLFLLSDVDSRILEICESFLLLSPCYVINI